MKKISELKAENPFVCSLSWTKLLFIDVELLPVINIFFGQDLWVRLCLLHFSCILRGCPCTPFFLIDKYNNTKIPLVTLLSLFLLS